MTESKGGGLSPQKRPRKDSNVDPRTRSEYWFEDGNIVLQAEDTLFRVHRAVLSRSSQIFKDTFAMPQPQCQENDHIEGCPVVPLSDTAKDLSNLISLLYDGEKMLNFGNRIPVQTLGSMLRLGRKYDIPYLEKKALESLHRSYPTTLPDWDALERPEVEYDLKIISKIISIAHEFHLFTIYPAAYATYLQWQYLKEIPSDAWIPPNAREHCVIGYSRIQEFIKRNSFNALCPPFLPSKECSGRHAQSKANSWEVMRNLPLWTTEEDKSFGIFQSCGIGATEKLCSRCRTEAKKLTERVRSEFWALLPTFFGLPPWSDLKDA